MDSPRVSAPFAALAPWEPATGFRSRRGLRGVRENVPWDSSAPWEEARAACPAGAGPGEGPVSSPFPSDEPHPGRFCRPHDHKNRLWLIHLYIYRKLSPNTGAQGGVETQVALWVRSVREARWSQLGPLGSTCRWGAPAAPGAPAAGEHRPCREHRLHQQLSGALRVSAWRTGPRGPTGSPAPGWSARDGLGICGAWAFCAPCSAPTGGAGEGAGLPRPREFGSANSL